VKRYTSRINRIGDGSIQRITIKIIFNVWDIELNEYMETNN